MMDKIFQAIEFAARAHSGQYRKGTKIPYIVHPLGVMQTLIESNCSQDVVIAGILHDVLEDTSYSAEDIRKEFGDNVLRLVEAASEPNHNDLSWEERKQHTINFLRVCDDYDVLSVCCADKLYNILSMQNDLLKIGDALWTRFNRPYEQQKWYYLSLAEIFAEKAKDASDMFSQFAKVAREVFA